jgi:hypothetical protein
MKKVGKIKQKNKKMNLEEIQTYKQIYIYRKSGKLEFEAENFGKVWVVWNYCSNDYKEIFELYPEEMLEFYREISKKGRKFDTYDWNFFEDVRKLKK